MFAVHHPYFLPWLGYFSKLEAVDNFIFLDNVRFSKRHYIDRTKIINMNAETAWVNIPIGENKDKNINEIFIQNIQFVDSILRTLEYSYKKNKTFNEVNSDLSGILKRTIVCGSVLSDIDIEIVSDISKLLNIRYSAYKASEIVDNIDATSRIIEISKVLNDKELLIGDGKSLSVHDIEKIKQANIKIYVQPFYEKHPQYFQMYRRKVGFEKGLSIVDSLYSIGIEDTFKLLKSVGLKHSDS